MNSDLFLPVVATALLALCYKIWHAALEARETANRIARETCSRAVVQLLDETVAFAGFRLARTYTFDYTTDGFERSQGFVVLAGRRLEAVGLAGGPT
jgi:hypothetical protein